MDFCIIAFPRSGTAWAANWLTTDRVLCLHDATHDYGFDALDYGVMKASNGRKCGVADTALWLHPEAANSISCPKVILRRPFDDVNDSLGKVGLPLLDEQHRGALDLIGGKHFDWRHLFDPVGAREIAEALGLPFDPVRHDLLRKLNVQRKFDSYRFGLH